MKSPLAGRGSAVAALLLALAAGRAEAQTLHVMLHPPSFEGYPILLEVARAFEARHPGVRVEVLSSASAAGETEKIKFHLAGRLPLDVTWIDITEFGAYLADEVLLDLQPYFDADPEWRPEEYFQGPLGALKDRRGHLYGLPSTFTPYVMYCNLDLLRQAGLPRPRPGWDWNDLLEIARRTTEDRDGDGTPDQWGISLTQWLQAIAPWIWQNGGRLLTADGRHTAFDEPQAVEALGFLYRLLHVEQVAAFDATFEAQLKQSLFQAGRVALYGPVGYWETYRFKHIEEFAWDVVPLPRGPGPGGRRATVVAMRSYVVPRTSRHPELAYEFVRALAGDRMQRGLARIGNGVPGLKRAARSEAFLKPEVPPDSEEVFLQVLDHARFLPVLANWQEIQSLCQAELDGMLLTGRLGPKEAGRLMARKADRFLERERRRRARTEVGAGTVVWIPAAAVAALVVLFLLLRGRTPGGRARREERAAAGFLSPWAAGFLLLVLGPMILSLVLSLTEWSPLRDVGEARWLGAGNYERLLQDGVFHDSLKATLLYVLLSVPLQIALALMLALLLRHPFRGSGVARTVVYMPTIVSPVIVGAVWQWLLRSRREGLEGPVNAGLRLLGVEGPHWLQDPQWVVPAFALMSLWTTGAMMLVFLAALQSLPGTLYEAARVDGAGPFRRFLHVTLPGISPLVLLNLIVGVIVAFQLFAQPYVMTKGGPENASRFLVLYLYDTGFRYLQMGYASAIAWVILVLLMLITLLILGSGRRWVHYEGVRP